MNLPSCFVGVTGDNDTPLIEPRLFPLIISILLMELPALNIELLFFLKPLVFWACWAKWALLDPVVIKPVPFNGIDGADMDWMGDTGLGGCIDPGPGAGCIPYCAADCFLLAFASGSLPNFGISAPEKRDFFFTRPAEAKTLGEGLTSANGKAWGVLKAASAISRVGLGFSVGSVVPLRIGGRPLPRRLFKVGIAGELVRGIR